MINFYQIKSCANLIKGTPINLVLQPITKRKISLYTEVSHVKAEMKPDTFLSSEGLMLSKCSVLISDKFRMRASHPLLMQGNLIHRVRKQRTDTHALVQL